MSKKKPPIKYTKVLAKWICDQVAGGYNVAELCRLHPNKMPEEKSVHRWRRQHPEFDEQYKIAYQSLLYYRLNEMDKLAREPLPSIKDIAIKYGLVDEKGEIDVKLARAQLNAHLEQIKIQIRANQFIVAKVMPKLVEEMSDRQQVDHNHDVTFQLADWSTLSLPNKVN